MKTNKMIFELSLESSSHKFPVACVGKEIQAEGRVSKPKGVRCGTFQYWYGVAEDCAADR